MATQCTKLRVAPLKYDVFCRKTEANKRIWTSDNDVAGRFRHLQAAPNGMGRRTESVYLGSVSWWQKRLFFFQKNKLLIVINIQFEWNEHYTSIHLMPGRAGLLITSQVKLTWQVYICFSITQNVRELGEEVDDQTH
jgi:hypothetical protein